MTRETKIGLVVGLGFIVVFAILLSHKGAADHRDPPHDYPTNVVDLHLDAVTGDIPPEPVAMNEPGSATTDTNTDGTTPDNPNATKSIERPTVTGEIVPTETETIEPPVVAMDRQPEIIPTPVTVPTPAVETIITTDAAVSEPTPAQPEPTPEVVPTPVRQIKYREHVVVQGDTLFNLSRRYNSTGEKVAVDKIYAANRDQLKTRDDLKLGQRLKIPVWAPRDQFEAAPNPVDLRREIPLPVNPSLEPLDTPVVRTDTPGAVASSPVVGWQWYEVGEKDTLYGIARRKLGSSRRWREIHDLNKSNLADPTKLRAGDKIKIPRNASGGDGERPNS